MEKTRRKFIIGTGAALLGGTLERARADEIPGPAPDITALLSAAGFTPGGPNSALMAVIGDVHINLNSADPKFTDRLDDRLVAELNALTPAITDLTIAGDLIVHHSVSIGGERYTGDYAMSRLEFRAMKGQLPRFRSGISVRAVPGNHDTDRYEVDAELWREELQLPPYQKSLVGGVPVFFLNSGHAGMLNPTQRAWFEAEASLISPDQEVLIIAHHPSFYYVYEEIGLKRIVAQAFARHRAPVWLVGGHGHAFGEQLLVSGSARFVQMEVTNGNPIQWGDSRSPGYVLLALQNGRVIHRAFRSLKDSGFQSLKPITQLTSYPLKWIFDPVEFPAAIFEEGFYDRTGRLIEFVGIDLKSHLIVCRSHTVRVDLSNSRGKIVDYLLPAHVWNGYAPPTCDFSATGANGPWMSVSFPALTGQRVYRIPIPIQFRNSPNLHIRTKTQLQGNWDGLSIYGWGLAADPAALTRYEKWLIDHYKTILENGQTAPTARPQGGKLTNIEHFAFNIALPIAGSATSVPIIAPGSPTPVTGTPTYSRTFRTVMDFRFARRTASSQSLVSYVVEHTTDLKNWSAIGEERLAITPLNTGWEEARFSLPVSAGLPSFCRARVTALDGGQGTSPHLSPGDFNNDGIDDLLQYAFDLQANDGPVRPYDPQRADRKAGIPIQGLRRGAFSRIVYPRLRTSVNPGVKYGIEQSLNLRDWTRLTPANSAERVTRTSGDWEEVETVITDSSQTRAFYRVALELTDLLS